MYFVSESLSLCMCVCVHVCDCVQHYNRYCSCIVYAYRDSFKFKSRARYFSPTQLPPASMSQDVTDGASSSSNKVDGDHGNDTGAT